MKFKYHIYRNVLDCIFRVIILIIIIIIIIKIICIFLFMNHLHKTSEH